MAIPPEPLNTMTRACASFKNATINWPSRNPSPCPRRSRQTLRNRKTPKGSGPGGGSARDDLDSDSSAKTGAEEHRTTRVLMSAEDKRKGGVMEFFIGGGIILYLVLLITLGVITIRKGHWVMFIVGIFLPLFWLIGALLPPVRERY